MTWARGVVEDAGESGRKTKPFKRRQEIGVSHPIVGFFLVQKGQGTTDLVFCCSSEDRLDRHGNVRGRAAADEARLIRMEKPRKDESQPISQDA
jgi:hypothetical protein